MTDHRPDSPDGDLIDDLVADIIDSAQRHVRIATEDMDRLTSRPELAERYGDFNLGLDFGGTGGRMARRDIHRSLRDKGMSLRRIAAQTGVSEGTVRNDLMTAQDYAPDLDEPLTDGVEPSAEAHGPGPLWKPLDQELKAIRKLSGTPATDVAASVPTHRREATAKRLRALGSYLGAVASKLEDFS